MNKKQSKKNSKKISKKKSKKTSKKNQQFFLDVFNNILDYNNSKVIIVFDKDGNIWFGLRDIFKILGYTNIDKAINKINCNNSYKEYYKNIRLCLLGHTLRNMQPNQIFINESGLYEVLTKSTKLLAKEFLKKYLINIMPTIRKTGKYISNNNDMNKIKKLNNKIDNYKTELNYYDTKYKFDPSNYGYLYINEDNQIKNGIKQKCFKIGYCLDMKKRVDIYKVGNFKHKLLAYIPLQIDRKQIEQCVKNRLKSHLTKQSSDTICYLSLDNLKKDIIDCINFENQHICNCVKCNKSYKLKSLSTHICNKKSIKDIIDYKIIN